MIRSNDRSFITQSQMINSPTRFIFRMRARRVVAAAPLLPRFNKNDSYPSELRVFAPWREVFGRQPRSLCNVLSCNPLSCIRLQSVSRYIFFFAITISLFNYFVISAIKNSRMRKKINFKINILCNFHPSYSRSEVDRFREFKSRLNPGTNSRLKRDVGLRRRAQIFTSFTTCTLCKTRSREILGSIMPS